MKFNLEIELGNKGMRTLHDLSESVRAVGEGLFFRYWNGIKLEDAAGGKIMDANGNIVGKWEVIDDTPARTTLAGTPRLS